MAPLDLYFLESEGSFEINFFKAAVGLWCCLAIAIGLAVATSTYFAGVISFLLAAVIVHRRILSGLTSTVGRRHQRRRRAMEAFDASGEGNDRGRPTRQDADRPGVGLLFDDIYRWVLRRVLHRDSGHRTIHLGELPGARLQYRFDFILLNVLFMAAYLLPWAVLAYYLMRSREIAA